MNTSNPFFTCREYRQRRQALATAVGESASVVIAGRGQTGAFDIFRQNNEFFYLSGVAVPQAYLVITGGTGEATLYLPAGDEKMERSEGESWNSDRAREVQEKTGIERVCNYGQLETDLSGQKVLYLPQLPGEGRQMCRDTLTHGAQAHAADPWDGRPSREERFKEEISHRVPGIEFRDLLPILDQLRGCKSPQEIDLMRAAGTLTAEAVCGAMKSTRPGIGEWQLAALADYIFRLNGADGGAYRPIVAGGGNIWNAHYYRNDCPLVSGDLVLMDYAPDLKCYTSDIGRMWPVSGTYHPWQRELYGYIVEYHRALLSVLRQGVTAEVVEAEAAAIMRPVIESRNWSKPCYREAALKTLEFDGHLSHGVGMAVHDVWKYRKEPLKAGVVLALDPQMWVPEEKLYIRVEDTIVITEEGIENLTEGAPLELDEVEKLMAGPGLLDDWSPVL